MSVKLSFLTLVIVSAAFNTALFAQISQVDLTFNAVPSANISDVNISSKGLLVQPDGKPVIWGGNFAVDGQAKGQIVRLNTDGSLDNTFGYCGCLIPNFFSNVALQPDGKFLIAGSGSNSQAKIVRLNTDGSHDGSFISVFTGTQALSSGADVVAIQPDGKVLASFNASYGSGFHGRHITRLNPDGSTDAGFSSIVYDSGRTIFGALRSLVLDPSGKFYLAITSFSGPLVNSSVRRFNSDGTLDSSWELPSFAPSGGVDIVGLDLQPDGALLVGGRFDSVNGVGKRNFVRLMPAGNVDLNFTAPLLGSGGGQIEVLQSGKILVGYNITGIGQLARLNNDGSLDNTFVLSSSVNYVFNKWVLDASERILFLGLSDQLVYRYFRLNPNGDVDPAFNPNATLFGQIHALAPQADGKILMAGNFTQFNGISRQSIVRANADGTLDTSFNAGTGFDVPPMAILLQPDGKLLAIGAFTTFNGTPRASIARINSDGSLDSAFSPTVSPLMSIALQADGKILIAGSFSSVNGIGRNFLARLNPDGTLDTPFNPIIGCCDVYEVIAQPDGKIAIGGGFSGVDGFSRANLARLNSDGTLDPTLNAGSPGLIRVLRLQPDGKYLIVNGSFFTIRRRNADGSPDNSFTASFDADNLSERRIDAILVQPDGSLIVGGRFDSVNATIRHNFVRLTANGALDQSFFPNSTDGRVRAIINHPDSKILVGGDFSRIENTLRAGIARLSIVPFHKTVPFDFDGDGKADISVFRPSTSRWYELQSSNGQVFEVTFGIGGDITAPADYDGDGKTDEAIFRPSTGDFWYLGSINNAQVNFHWGQSGDIPRPSDFDGDGKADFVVYRPSNSAWYRYGSTGQVSITVFGIAEDKPLVGDFDGDGKSDLAVFRPSTGDWWYAASGTGGQHRVVHWGQTGDVPAPGDFDGDGKTDFAVFRPSNGVWYILNSSNGSFVGAAFGISEDRPIPADYDGDGKTDIAVFRPSTGIWYLLQSTSGFGAVQFGVGTDVAIPNSFVP